MPDLLGKVLGQEAKRRGLAEARLLTGWAGVIGETIATSCQPVSLDRHGVLLLDVTSSAALEIQHAELQMIERINDFFGRPTVSRLRLRQSPPKRRTFKAPEIPLPKLDDKASAAIDRSVADIGDPALRSALASLGRTLGSKAKMRRR